MLKSNQGGVEYLTGILEKEGFQFQALPQDGKKRALVFRLKGSGRAKPLMLLGHATAVRNPAGYTPHVSTEKFKIKKSKFFYGPGAGRDLSLTAAFAANLIGLKQSGKNLERDIIFLVLMDDIAHESLPWVFKNHSNDIESKFVLTSGGFLRLNEEGQADRAGIACSEKIHYPIKITAPTASRLNTALKRIKDWQRPVSLNFITRLYFEKLNTSPYLVEKNSRDYWMTRNQFPVANVDDHKAVIEARLLSDDSVRDVLLQLGQIIDDKEIKFDSESPDHLTRPPFMSTKTAVYQEIDKTYAHYYPSIQVVPFQSNFSLGLASLRVRGIKAYGIAMPLTEEDERRIGGAQERLNKKAFKKSVNWLWDIILGISSQRTAD